MCLDRTCTLVLTSHFFLRAWSGAQVKLRARKIGRVERNLSTPVKETPISCNSYVTWILTSNFHKCFFFWFTLLFKSFILQSKGILTIKQINIDLFWNKKVKNEKAYSHKYINRKTPVIVSFSVHLQAWGLTVLRKRDSNLDAFYEISEVLQNLIFTEDSWATSSDFQLHCGHITCSISNKST